MGECVPEGPENGIPRLDTQQFQQILPEPRSGLWVSEHLPAAFVFAVRREEDKTPYFSCMKQGNSNSLVQVLDIQEVMELAVAVLNCEVSPCPLGPRAMDLHLRPFKASIAYQ